MRHEVASRTLSRELSLMLNLTWRQSRGLPTLHKNRRRDAKACRRTDSDWLTCKNVSMTEKTLCISGLSPSRDCNCFWNTKTGCEAFPILLAARQTPQLSVAFYTKSKENARHWTSVAYWHAKFGIFSKCLVYKFLISYCWKFGIFLSEGLVAILYQLIWFITKRKQRNR